MKLHHDLQDDVSYRKVDVISKEEFDHQRGMEEEQLVFTLDEVQTAVGTPGKPPAPAPSSLQTPNFKTPVSAQNSAERPIKPEKRARFYPVPRKQGYDSQVRGGDEGIGRVWSPVMVCVGGKE